MKTDPLNALKNAEWDKVSKMVATGLGFLYAVGYLVVSVHLSRYGISSLELFKLHYLVAGFWCVAPFSFYFLITSAMRGIVLSWANQSSKPLKRMSAKGTKAFLICVHVAFAVALVVTAVLGSPDNFRGMVKARGVLTAEILLLLFSIEFIWMFFTQPMQLAAAPIETQLLFSGSMAKLFAFFLFAPLLTYLGLFSTDIYPHIPFAWGGRLPSLGCVSVAGQHPFDRQLSGKGWHAASNSSVQTTASERAIVCCHFSNRWGAGNRV
jgi:hypothetical protein